MDRPDAVTEHLGARGGSRSGRSDAGLSRLDEEPLSPEWAAIGEAIADLIDGSRGWADQALAERRDAAAVEPAPIRSADTESGWRCECGDLNRWHEAFCYRCGAGRHEPECTEGACVC